MARAPFQVLVIPYRCDGDSPQCAIFQRADDLMWQFISGGGEESETPMDAAIREASEEAGISSNSSWTKLDSIASIPRCAFSNNEHWPASLYVVPEYCFAVRVIEPHLRLSLEHCRFEWLNLNLATARLSWDSNRVALWELEQRLLPSVGKTSLR